MKIKRTLYRVDFGVPCGNSTEIGSSGGGGFSRAMLANCGRGMIFGHEADLLDSGAAAFLNTGAVAGAAILSKVRHKNQIYDSLL